MATRSNLFLVTLEPRQQDLLDGHQVILLTHQKGSTANSEQTRTNPGQSICKAVDFMPQPTLTEDQQRSQAGSPNPGGVLNPLGNRTFERLALRLCRESCWLQQWIIDNTCRPSSSWFIAFVVEASK